MAPSITSRQASFEAIFRTSTASASVAIRSALGNGASSIVRADELTKDSLPVVPCLAFRWQAGGGSRSQPQRDYAFVYIYDGLPKFWTRINPLIDLIYTAFFDADLIPYCDVEYKAYSGEITDQSLGLRAKYIPFIVSTR
jgi:hypothetical protein